MTLSSPKCRSKKRRFVKLFFPFALTAITACPAPMPDPPVILTAAHTTSPAPVDINKAGSAELESLPGIGPRTAQKIIEHRNRFGRFRTAPQLMLVEGIGEKQFLKIRSMITTR